MQVSDLKQQLEAYDEIPAHLQFLEFAGRKVSPGVSVLPHARERFEKRSLCWLHALRCLTTTVE